MSDIKQMMKALNCIISYNKQYTFFQTKQDTCIFGLKHYLLLKYNIEKSGYLYRFENEKCEKLSLGLEWIFFT